jgi:hypothetical protein
MYHRRVFEIGSSLREARLRNGYEISDAEAATKIRTKYLKALEDERFELLPAPTYIKGFLHSYAEFLGLDGQLYVDEYNSRYAAAEEDVAIRPRRQPQSRAHRRVESRVLLLALLGILAATALVLIAWRFGGSAPASVANLESRQAAPPAVRQNPVEKPAVDLVLTAVGGNSLVIVRRGSGNGEPVFDGTIERGRSMQFTGKRLWLNVGSPDNLVARLNGKAVRLPARREPVVLVATRKGLRPASA